MRYLITGVTGQDGLLAAEQLLAAGHEVCGTTRQLVLYPQELTALPGQYPKAFRVAPVDPLDAHSLARIVNEFRPERVLHFAGLSHVGHSFAQPNAAYSSIVDGTLLLLETLAGVVPGVPMYFAGSSEMFGNDYPMFSRALNANSLMRPVSPYGLAKQAAFEACRYYRRREQVKVFGGIAFNHESTRRPPRFVTRAISMQIAALKRGDGAGEIHLGNLEARRDWGWAPEYVAQMIRLLELKDADDVMLCTGKSASVGDLAAHAVAYAQQRKYVGPDVAVLSTVPSDRQQELHSLQGDPSQASNLLDWTAQHDWRSVIEMMVDHDCQGVAHG